MKNERCARCLGPPGLFASGVLAANAVAEVLAQGAHISVVNLVDVLSKLAERGQGSEEAYDRMVKRGLLGGMLEVHPLPPEECAGIAQLRPSTKDQGLSLGDRACLALGLKLGFPVFTADRDWQKLDLDVVVHIVR